MLVSRERREKDNQQSMDIGIAIHTNGFRVHDCCFLLVVKVVVCNAPRLPLGRFVL